MALLYIAEYAASGRDITGRQLQAPMQPPLAEQTVVNTGASAQSVALNVKTTMVRLHTDSICSYLVGANPTATTANSRMAANTTEYIAIDKQAGLDGALKIAVVLNT